MISYSHLSLVLLQTLLPHHVDELPVGDCPVAVEVRLHDELEYLVLSRVLADRPHDQQQLLRRDGAAPILQQERNEFRIVSCQIKSS